jgi:hypothetical protein
MITKVSYSYTGRITVIRDQTRFFIGKLVLTPAPVVTTLDGYTLFSVFAFLAGWLSSLIAIRNILKKLRGEEQ